MVGGERSRVMIYVYRRKPSKGAVLLAQALGGRKIRSLRRFPCRSDDHLVCWGEYEAELEIPGKALNNTPLQDKLADAIKLAEKGIPTIEVSRTRPIIAQTYEVAPADVRGGFYSLEQAVELQQRLADFIHRSQEAIAIAERRRSEEWLGRSRYHIGGRDLLRYEEAQQNGYGIDVDYFVKKENLVREYRVHSFKGKSIRAGVKAQVADEAHPWIRSMEVGWRILYDGVSVRQRHRDLAHQAVGALGLDFGAVDIGERPDGSLIVLEVNRAPGLDGGTIEAYAKAVRKWIEENDTPRVESE
jgi:hypothetical protein